MLSRKDSPPESKLATVNDIALLCTFVTYNILLATIIFSIIGKDFNLSSFLGIFIPGTITVSGSYYLYVRKEQSNSKKLRTALRAELAQMEHIENLPSSWEDEGIDPSKQKIPAEKMPPPSHISTAVYESNAGNLGRLRNDEMEAVVEFYSTIGYIKEIMRSIHKDEDPPQDAHETVYTYLQEYSDLRQELIDVLDKNKSANEVDWPSS